MPEQRLRVLVLSELFPNPVRPAFGTFVERQVFHLQSVCDNVVVVPTRVFPPLRLWRDLPWPRRFVAEWRRWWADLAHIPRYGGVGGIPVFYPRYTSPPKQLFHGLWGFFAYPFLRRQLRVLYEKEPFDLIHAHYANPCGVIALLSQRWLKIPVVLSIHGADVTYTAKQNPLSAAIIRWVFHNADTLIANSTWTARQIVRYGGNQDDVEIVRLGGNSENAEVTYLKEDLSEIAGRHLTDHGQMVTLLSVGYLEERKGHAYVLRAVKELVRQGYKIRYIIVGDGSKNEHLRALAGKLGLMDVVAFEGYKAHNDVWPYFAACDIFALPSWNEAFGVVYIEALSMGKPVIGCEGEGGPEDLKALGDCVELVKPRDVESLVQALKRLIDNPDRRYLMGEIGRKIVAEHFTWERNTTTTLTIYRQMLEACRV